MAPAVSVIIPTYNRAHCIGDAIDSVLRQSFRDFEPIVVDDGSTDDTSEVLGAYGSRITVVRQANGGASSARNTGSGLPEASGLHFWTPTTRGTPTS